MNSILPPQFDDVDFERRFGGIARLYGAHALERFRTAHICVVGVGGVGSWIVEALARSAIGQALQMPLKRERPPRVGAQGLEHGIAIEKASIEDADLGLVGDHRTPVDQDQRGQVKGPTWRTSDPPAGPGGTPEQPCTPQVSQRRPSVHGVQDVAGRDVGMHDAVPMQCVQGLCDRHQCGHHLAHGQRPDGPHQGAQ